MKQRIIQKYEFETLTLVNLSKLHSFSFHSCKAPFQNTNVGVSTFHETADDLLCGKRNL